MSVDREEVKRIARLAHLHYEADEAEHLTEELNQILDYASRLRGGGEQSRVDGGTERHEDGAPERRSGVEGLTGVRPSSGIGPDELLLAPTSFAPRLEHGFFAVPPVPGLGQDPSAGKSPDRSPSTHE